MRVVFMGTPEFAVPSLKALVEAGMDVVGVVTQPDRPRGRGKKVLPSAVKEAALELGLPVFQPVRLRDESSVRELEDLKPDVIVVTAFGQILPPGVLGIPPLGCVNVHASLLPRYRGAAPIQRAIMNGDTATGVTIMKMDAGLDTGDILMQARTAISPDDTFGVLHDRLSAMGAALLPETLSLLAAGKLTGVPQDNGGATYAPLISREDEIINWHNNAVDIKNQVRGLDPWPGARTRLDNKVLKVWRVKEYSGAPEPGLPGEIKGRPLPGQVLGPVHEGLAVQCGDQPLVICELQLEGGKRLKTADFLRGVRISPGTTMGFRGGPEK